jgi:uncharacterized protein (TIGR03435 family)
MKSKTKILALCVLAILIACSPLLFAQDVSGTWQGTLNAKKPLRIVVEFTKDDGRLHGALYSLDQGGTPFGISAVSAQGTAVSFSIDALNGNYLGKLSADGNTIDGTWTQGKPLPLILVRATKDTAWDLPAPSKQMASAADPSFEVATIKPSKPGGDGKGFYRDGRAHKTVNTSLADLIEFAYNLHSSQIVGGPDWLETAKFDTVGVQDVEGDPSYEQSLGMYRKLLADRFQLKFHYEKKELSVYVLTVARGGPKNLTRSANPQPGFSIPLGPGKGGVKLSVYNGTMTNFAIFGLQGAVMDRPVIDQTGLPDRYDFSVTWTPDLSQFGGKISLPAKDNAAPGLFTAISEQLGLKLEPKKIPVDVMVIDHVALPSAN